MESNVVKMAVKRKVITLETKIKILDRLQKGEKMSTIANSYEMNESTVRTIKKNERNIRNSVMSGSSLSSRFSSYTRDTAIVLMEKALMIWIEDNTQKNIPVDSNTIKLKALRIYNLIKEQANSKSFNIEETSTFTASKGWFERFKKRYSLHNLKIKSQLASPEENKPKKFPFKLNIIEEHSYTADQMFNPDAIELTKKIPNRTYLPKSENTDSDFKAVKDDIITDEELVSLVLIPETVYVSEDEASEPTLFTPKKINDALKLARKLENFIFKIDPDTQRALNFQRNLRNTCAEYEEIYNELTKNKTQTKIKTKHENLEISGDSPIELSSSSDEEDEFEPVMKKFVKMVEDSSENEDE